MSVEQYQHDSAKRPEWLKCQDDFLQNHVAWMHSNFMFRIHLQGVV